MQPLPPSPPELSVTTPVSQAMDTVKRVLFQPFEAGKWLVIGFCAWLACLGEQSFNTGYHFGPIDSGRGGGNLRHELDRIKQYMIENLYWIGPLVAALVLAGLVLWVLFTWLSSRGKFMFLHCVALNTAEVSVPWRKFGRESNSLWVFRLVLGLLGALLTLPLVAVMLVAIFRMAMAGAASAGGIALAAGALLTLILVAVVFALIGKLTTDFVVPLMFLHRTKCLAGWRELRALFSGRIGDLILYVLFQIVLSLAIGLLVLMVVLVTCCLAGCLMALPYLGTVLLLPVLMFQRAYSLHYLAQFGRDFDVFTPAAEAGPGNSGPTRG